MMERIESKGYWFLPNKPEETVAGILTFVPKEKITLELIGSFENCNTAVEAFLEKKEEKVIYGITSEAKQVTLINCYPSGSVNLSSTFPIIKYTCQYLIIGKHLQSIFEPLFYEAYVLFPILTQWCYPGALNEIFQLDNENNKKIKTVTISFDIYDDKNNDQIINETQIDENTKLYLKKGINFDGSKYFLTPKIEQYTFLEIHKQTDSSIEEYLSVISLYEQFLSLASLEAVECSKIYLYDRNLFQEQDGEKIYHPVEFVYIQRYTVNADLTSKKNDFLFDYDTIKDQYIQIIKKWFTEKEDIAPIRSHLIESIKHKNVFSSVDFLIVIQALEGFCTRFRRKNTLTIMLQDLISEFSCIDKLKANEICIKEVVDSRHYYSHFMKKSERPHAKDGMELYILTHKIRKLLICCLLDFIGFEKPQINKILDNCHNKLLIDESNFNF